MAKEAELYPQSENLTVITDGVRLSGEDATYQPCLNVTKSVNPKIGLHFDSETLHLQSGYNSDWASLW